MPLYGKEGTPFTFSASATVNAPITTSLGEEILRTGTPIRVTAPIYVGDSQFSHWEINGVKVASAPVYQFQMPAKNTALRAVYRDLVFLSVDKSQPVSALAVSDLLESAPDMFLGAGAKTGDYTLGDTGVTLSKDFLLSLDNGDHRFYIASTEGGVLKENATFTVRVTGGTIAPAPDYSGLTDKGAEYYAKTFEYGGKTYHRVASTDEEFRVMLEYFVLVDGVLQMKASGNDKTKKISFDFWVCGDLNTRLINKDNILERAVASCSFPMHPSSIGLESYGNESGNAVTLSLTYVNGLNDTPSEEKAVTAKDRQKLLTSPGRAADYDSFAIDALTTTAEIRTVYELEVLPFGVKPTFDTSAADTGAKEVYEKARDILRLIIDDSMDDYAKVAAIYAWLGLNVTYDWTTFETDGQSASAYTVKGALIDRVAVCDGFASALRLLCQIEGIRAEEITGVNELGKEGTGHAWNKVWIGGAVFGVDSTWCRQNLKDGETVIPIVTLQYLFLDELGLLTSEHYENANPNNPYVVNLADAGFSMHNVVETDRFGHTFTVSDVIGFEALVKYLKDNGITAAEFYTTVDPSAFPGSASYTLFGAEEDDYCYILFE